MLLYNSELNKPLNKLGIDIPLHDERAQRLFLFLQTKFSADNWPVASLKSYLFDDLQICHTSRYIEELKNTPATAIERCYSGYCSKPIRSAELIVLKVLQQAYATYEAMSYSLEHKFVYYLGGGMHHAMQDGGRGFCLVNDIALGIRKLQGADKIETAWIIDVDAHKGDGCAEIFWGDSTVKTFSIHMKDGWPLDGSEDDRSKIPSTMDVEITEDEDYLERLQVALPLFIQQHAQPDLICVVGGVDVWEDDKLASSSLLQLSAAEVLERDQFVFEQLRQLGIPITYVMAGGYGKNSWQLYADFILWAHANLKS